MNTREKQVELVKKLLKTGVSDDARMVLEKQFPEVVESEDERIRKAIFKALSKKEARDVLCDEHIEVSDALSYLEKQKEQNKSHLSLTEEELHKIRSEEYTNGFNDAAFGGKYKGWSEEDEKNWNEYIERLKSEYEITPNVVLWDDINWLEYLHEKFKSLRPQPRWKPSEKQLKSLCVASSSVSSRRDVFNLDTLYHDLKELM